MNYSRFVNICGLYRAFLNLNLRKLCTRQAGTKATQMGGVMISWLPPLDSLHTLQWLTLFQSPWGTQCSGEETFAKCLSGEIHCASSPVTRKQQTTNNQYTTVSAELAKGD